MPRVHLFSDGRGPAPGILTMKFVQAVARPPFFGVWATRSAFVLALLGWGVGFYGPPIYLAQVSARSGWALGLVSAAVTVHFLIGALVNANLPRLYARLGLPTVTILGSVLAALGVWGWAVAGQPWQLFVAALATGCGWVGMGAVAINTIVATWYDRQRPMALSKAYNGASMGGVVLSPLWVVLIGALGFPGAAAVVGLTMVGVVLFLARRVLVHTPASLGQQRDGGALASVARGAAGASARAPLPGRALWRDRAFVTLAAGMAIGLFAQIGLLAHSFHLFAPSIGAQRMGALMGLATLCAMLGRYVSSWAMQRGASRRAAGAGSYLVQAGGVALLLLSAGQQPVLIVLGMMLLGGGIGNATSIPPLIAQAEFAAGDVARVVALIVAIGQGTYAFAPALFGVLPGADGAAGLPASLFMAGIGIQLLAAGVMLAGRKRAAGTV